MKKFKVLCRLCLYLSLMEEPEFRYKVGLSIIYYDPFFLIILLVIFFFVMFLFILNTEIWFVCLNNTKLILFIYLFIHSQKLFPCSFKTINFEIIYKDLYTSTKQRNIMSCANMITWTCIIYACLSRDYMDSWGVNVISIGSRVKVGQLG